VDFGRSMDPGRASVKASCDVAPTLARCIKCAFSFEKKS